MNTTRKAEAYPNLLCYPNQSVTQWNSDGKPDLSVLYSGWGVVVQCHIFPEDNNHAILTSGAALLANMPSNIHHPPLRTIAREETNGVATLSGAPFAPWSPKIEKQYAWLRTWWCSTPC